ncbi:MAG TPA: PilZ domain-containing protein, partial [Bdellovibrio sp.]|nr:PilZ domain-containing protein [Bdellovibrio sp.]
QIWGRGHTEWMNLERWRQYLREAPSTKSEDLNSQPWKIRVDSVEREPMRYSDLISYLKTLNDFSTVDLSYMNSGWREIYAFQKVVEELGISRRSHPRVPIVGTLEITRPEGNLSCRVISISEGGLGINDAVNLHIGERFSAVLTSPNLYVTINAGCEVVYVGDDGYAGIRFTGLPEEFKSSIIEYVNKFAAL